jgi:hypothetical protein
LSAALHGHLVAQSFLPHDHHASNWNFDNCPSAWKLQSNLPFVIPGHDTWNLRSTSYMEALPFLPRHTYLYMQTTYKPLANYFVGWYTSLDKHDRSDQYNHVDREGTTGIVCQSLKNGTLHCWDYFIHRSRPLCNKVVFARPNLWSPHSLWNSERVIDHVLGLGARSGTVIDQSDSAAGAFSWGTLTTQYDPYFWNYSTWSLNQRWNPDSGILSFHFGATLICRLLHSYSDWLNHQCYLATVN